MSNLTEQFLEANPRPPGDHEVYGDRPAAPDPNIAQFWYTEMYVESSMDEDGMEAHVDYDDFLNQLYTEYPWEELVSCVIDDADQDGYSLIVKFRGPPPDSGNQNTQFLADQHDLANQYRDALAEYGEWDGD